MKSLRDYLPESLGGYMSSDSLSPIPGGFNRNQFDNICPFKVKDTVKIEAGSHKYADEVGIVEKIRERTILVKMKDGSIQKFKEDVVSLDDQQLTIDQSYARSLRNLRQLAGLSDEE
jgi:hypothetical protein